VPAALAAVIDRMLRQDPAERFALPGVLGPVAFAPDGRTLAAVAYRTDKARELRLWDAVTGEPAGSVPGSAEIFASPGGANALAKLRFSPDGRRLLGGKVGWPLVHPAPVVWDLTNNSHHELEQSFYAEWLADGGLVTVPARGAGQYEVQVWDGRTGTEQLHWRLDDPAPPSVSDGPIGLSADGRVLASLLKSPPLIRQRWLLERLNLQRLPFADPRQAVKLWNAPTGRRLGALGVESHSLWLSPDGRTLVTIGRSGITSLWDVPPARPWPLFLVLLTAQAALAAAFVGWRRRRSARRKLAAGPGTG